MEISNGARLWVPLAVLASSLVSTVVAGLFWFAHLEDRIVALEASREFQIRRLDQIDLTGTRGSGAEIYRLDSLAHRIDMLEQRANQRWGAPP